MGETCDCGRPVDDHFPLDCFNELRNGWDKSDATVEKLASDFATMTDLSNATIARLQEALAAARRECEGLRKVLGEVRRAIDEDTTFYGAVLRVEIDKALAAPADGEETYRCPHGRGSNESCRFCSVTGELE